MSNTEQKQKILLKRTTEVDRPSIPSGASHGELFLNIASGANAHNKISTMQIGTNNPIIWSDDVANEKKFASKTEVEALVKEVEDNELVTATAISTMNASAGFNEDGTSALPNGVSLTKYIEGIHELVNDFNGDIAALYSQKVDKTTTVNGQALSSNVTITKVNSAITANSATTADKVKNSLTVGSKTYNGSSAVTITAADLGLESALKYHGKTKTILTDGATTNPITLSDGTSHTALTGCVVISSGYSGDTKEFLWNGSKWEELGDESSWKPKQTAKTDPTANGSGLTFIDSISQDTNGVITASKKAVNLGGYWKKTERVNSATTTSFLEPYESILDASSDVNKNKGYFCYVNPGGAGDTNVPRAGILTSFRDSQGCATQFLSDYKYDDLYYRSAKSDTSSIGKVWTDWHKIAYIDSFKAGSNVTFSQSAGTIIINATDTKYTHPTTSGNKHIPSGGSSGQFLGWSSDGTAAWVNNPNTDTATTETGHYTPTGTPTTYSGGWITAIKLDSKKHVTSVTTASTAHTHSEYATTTALNDLIGDIEDNELVISTIVTKINDSCGFNENSESVLPNGQNLTEAITELQNHSHNKVNSATTSVSATTVPWAGVTDKPSFAIYDGNNYLYTPSYINVGIDQQNDLACSSIYFESNYDRFIRKCSVPRLKEILGRVSSATTSHSATTVYSTTANSKVYLVGVTGTGSSYQQLYKNTGVTMSASCIYATSDERLKDFKGDIECDLEKLKNIPKKYFSWKDDESKSIQIGTSAQEVHKLYPEIVSIDDDGTHSVAYDRLSIVALSAIDKLYDMVKELQTKNDKLENRIKELENK